MTDRVTAGATSPARFGDFRGRAGQAYSRPSRYPNPDGMEEVTLHSTEPANVLIDDYVALSRATDALAGAVKFAGSRFAYPGGTGITRTDSIEGGPGPASLGPASAPTGPR